MGTTRSSPSAVAGCGRRANLRPPGATDSARPGELAEVRENSPAGPERQRPCRAPGASARPRRIVGPSENSPVLPENTPAVPVPPGRPGSLEPHRALPSPQPELPDRVGAETRSHDTRPRRAPPRRRAPHRITHLPRASSRMEAGRTARRGPSYATKMTNEAALPEPRPIDGARPPRRAPICTRRRSPPKSRGAEAWPRHRRGPRRRASTSRRGPRRRRDRGRGLGGPRGGGEAPPVRGVALGLRDGPRPPELLAHEHRDRTGGCGPPSSHDEDEAVAVGGSDPGSRRSVGETEAWDRRAELRASFRARCSGASRTRAGGRRARSQRSSATWPRPNALIRRQGRRHTRSHGAGARKVNDNVPRPTRWSSSRLRPSWCP